MTKKNIGETKEDFLVQDRRKPLKLPFCHPVTKIGAAKYHFAYGIHHD